MELENAEEGKRYLVTWGDCIDCGFEGSFEAVLTAKKYVPASYAPDDSFLKSVTFDNGVTISGYGPTAEEVAKRPHLRWRPSRRCYLSRNCSIASLLADSSTGNQCSSSRERRSTTSGAHPLVLANQS